MSEGLTLLRGIGKDGETVVFLDGEVEAGAVEKIAAEWSGDPLGEPADGTAAFQIAKVRSFVEV